MYYFIPSEQPCQPLENHVHTSSFTWINPIFKQIQLDFFVVQEISKFMTPPLQGLGAFQCFGERALLN